MKRKELYDALRTAEMLFDETSNYKSKTGEDEKGRAQTKTKTRIPIRPMTPESEDSSN